MVRCSFDSFNVLFRVWTYAWDSEHDDWEYLQIKPDGFFLNVTEWDI